ncbi:PLP-dependent transferase [Agrocybe pediades]|nr:PLP-dependent transferase [Agrocybe pediades]
MASALGFRLSKGALTTIAPPIPKAYEWAARYIPKPTLPLLDMSQGVPGIPPPAEVHTALGTAASSTTSFGYTRWDGEPTLRQALVDEMKVVYGPETDLEMADVALTSGCNLAFVAVAMSLVDAGDEVILPVPWYFNHQMALNLLGVKPVPLFTSPESGFLPSVAECKKLITPKTRAIVLVTPNNPTGATYPPSLIASFATLAREHNLPLIIDETYRDFITIGSPPHDLFSRSAANPWRHTFIHLFSFSKSYCLPGHRLGAIVASPTLLQSIKAILDTLQICPPRPIQMALGSLLPSLRPFISDTATQIEARHKLFKDKLPLGWKVGAQGGYFAFVRHPWTCVTAEDVSRRLAVRVGVVTLPASFFMEEKPQGLVPGDSVEAEEESEDYWGGLEREEEVQEEERWIRFSVANVDDRKVELVCARLAKCVDEFGWRV